MTLNVVDTLEGKRNGVGEKGVRQELRTHDRQSLEICRDLRVEHIQG